MGKRMRKHVLALPGLGCAVIVLAAGLHPKDVESNLAAWARLLGIETWPPWLTDGRVVIGATGLTVAFYIWLWFDNRRLGRREVVGASTRTLAPHRATHKKLDTLSSDVQEGLDKVISQLTGKDVSKLASDAEHLANEIGLWIKAQLAKDRPPPPPIGGPRDTAARGYFLFLRFRDEYRERLVHLRDACHAKHIYDPVFEEIGRGGNAGNQTIFAIINGLRALAEKLRSTPSIPDSEARLDPAPEEGRPET